MTIIRDIGINVILLFGLTLIVTLPRARFDSTRFWMRALFGVLIGGMTIFVMMHAWRLDSGAIFDTRSVMIGVSALFFPPISAIIATAIAVIYRMNLGGAGVYAGVLSLVFSCLIGIVWKTKVSARLHLPRYVTYYLFGLVVHVFVVLSQFAFPYPQSIAVIRLVGPMMLVGFPIATLRIA